jgi:4,5-dihydroxyphthalate decarboxylase
MANPIMRMGFREPTIDTNRPLLDGTVKVEGFDLEVSDYRGSEYIDAWDASFGGLMQTKAAGKHPFVSIPAFPNRKFRLSYIFVNTASGIVSPRDLEGKRVFVSSTAGIWARGALLNHYGVDFTKVNWVMFANEAQSWAPGVTVESVSRGDDTMEGYLDGRLLSGELDAVIEPNVLSSITRRDPRVARLFRDFKTEEQNYYRATGIFPISHMVSLTTEFVDKYPEAPVALLKAYRQARDVAFDNILGSDPQVLTISWAAAAVDEQRALMGENYWAYNIEGNRRSLDAMMLFSYQMGITPELYNVESFLDPQAAALAGV